jgi:hypothetical protein
VFVDELCSTSCPLIFSIYCNVYGSSDIFMLSEIAHACAELSVHVCGYVCAPLLMHVHGTVRCVCMCVYLRACTGAHVCIIIRACTSSGASLSF